MKLFTDERGVHQKFFYKDSIPKKFEGIKEVFITQSHKGVIRGLHSQRQPFQQKIIQVVQGYVNVRIFIPKGIDVDQDFVYGNKAMHSPCGIVYYFDCHGQQHKPLYVPAGAYIGYLALEDNTTAIYLADSDFSSEGSLTINPFDPTLNIDWSIPAKWGMDKENLILSDGDKNGPMWGDIKND